MSGGEDLHINITDIEYMKRKQTLTGHSDWITSMAVERKFFVTGSLDKTIKVWDTNSG
jgi:WD40 repeat protein